MSFSRLVRGSICFAFVIALLFAAGCQMPKVVEPVGPQYVRVRKIDGKWWFVRGNEQFVAMGVNVVQPVDSTPAKQGPRYDVLPKYNNDVAAWAADTAARLKSWNFNSVAGWSHEYLYTNTPMYHTRVVWMGPWGNRDSRLIDVFSERYAAAVDKTARKEIAPHATNEYLIGYFTNNELPWYGEKGWPSDPDISMLSRYMHLPPKAPGKLRVVEFLRGRYGNDFEAFSKNWETRETSFDDLAKNRRMKPKTREAKKDVITWSGIVADQYFKVCNDALRKYDPNHLNLGVRFADRAYEPVIAACAKYADVVSLNHYRKTGFFDAQKVGNMAALAQKPMMITEYSWRAMENSSGCKNGIGADVTVDTQQDRAERFRIYVTNALAQPYIVSLDWFMYHDQPPGGRFDGENSNYGLVDIHDNVYTTLLDTITEVNARAREIHRNSDTPMPEYDPIVLADYREITIPGIETLLAKPVTIADFNSSFEGWGDTARNAEIVIEPTEQNTFQINGKPGRGWGCGVSFKPIKTLPANDDGSVSVLGATKCVVRMDAPKGVTFQLGIQESGHGGLDAQTYGGYGGADGESYVSRDVISKEGMQDYVFDLFEMDTSPAYGNQRGNCVVNTPAIAQCHLYFPGSQKDFEIEVESIRFE